MLRTLARKWPRENDDSQSIASFLEVKMAGGLAHEEFMEEMGGWFLDMKESLRKRIFPPDFPVERLIGALQTVAERRGIKPDRFYTAILSRILTESGEREESGPVLSKHQTKEKILDAALEVFSEKGFHSATVDEIAERAGLGKGTVYRHFANKETLFNELVRIRLKELEERAWLVFDGHDDVLTMIRKYLQIYFEFFDRNQGLYRLINQERPELGEHVQDLYFRKVMKRAPLLKKKIYEASQQGVLKDVDFQTVFYGVMGFIHGVIQKWLARDCSYPLVEELPAALEVLFYGFVKTQRQQSADHH